LRTRLLTLSAALTGLLVGLVPTAASAAELPDPTPARTGPPSSIAVLGDSISTATGTGFLGSEIPNNSWSTGTTASVNSTYRRLLALNPAINNQRVNMASNGRRMEHMASQATAMPATTQYVQVQLGGNDLCKDSVAQMTPVEVYRMQFVAGLNAIAERAPDALVSVQSIPDIYNLWYIRYAPAVLNGGESNQASQARSFVNFGLLPCDSLLANPASIAEADMARRQAVREHNIAFNKVLEEECAKVLRCRFDDHATFNFSSNRDAEGNMLPRSQWGFTDLDISRNTGTFASGCPLTALFGTVCGDHFHPSLAGQTKLAATAWESGYQWSDATAPAVTIDADGDWRNDPVIEVEATDAAGVRGIEIRVDGGPWETTLGASASVTVDDGTSVVEARALDVNGNLSASQVVEVNVDTTDPTAGIDGPADGAVFTIGETPDAPDYACDDDRSGVASCEDDGIDTSTVGAKTLTVTATDNAGNVHTESVSYSVHYAYSGLTGALAGVREHQVGAVLPVRFTLADADDGLRSDATATVELVGGATSSSQPGNGKTANVARWDADEQQYVLNLATRGLAAGAYELVVTLDDGTEHRTPITLVAR
jgi:lysophospholipase L1-like esterase